MKTPEIKYIALYISFLAYQAIASTPQIISPKQIALIQNKSLKDKFIEEKRDAYVPFYVKTTIKKCVEKYPELTQMIDLSALTDQTRSVTSRTTAEKAAHEFVALLKKSDLKEIDPSDNTIAVIERYLNELESGSMLTDSETDLDVEEDATRSINLFQCQTGIALSAGGILNVYGNSNVGTQAYGNTVNVGLNSPLNLTGSVNLTGTLILSSLTGGVLTSSNTGLISSGPTTNNAVQIGNITGTLTSIPVGTDGQVLIGATNAEPLFTGLSAPINPSGASSILYTTAPNFLSIRSVPLFGNVIIVDWLNGNDSTATATNCLPFQTITGAMNAIGGSGIATNVNPIVVWVMPGIYNETVTMQPYTSLIGMSEGAGNTVTSGGTIGTDVATAGVTIQQLNLTSATTLVTMAEYSRLENVNLVMTNTFPSTGILLSGTMTATARIKSVNLNTTRTGTSVGGASYGVQNTGSANPGPEISVLEDCTISMNTTNPRGDIAIENGPLPGVGGLNINNCSISMTASGGSASGGNLYGVQNASTVQSSMIINNSNITVSNSVTLASGGSATYGINATSLCSITLNNCQISVSASGVSPSVYGINSTQPITLNSSTLTVSSTGTATLVAGIQVSGSTSTCNNSSITISNASTTSTVYGVRSTNTSSIVLNNAPIAISSTTSATLYGIFNSSTGQCTIAGCPINVTSTSNGTIRGLANSGTLCTVTASPITVSSGSATVYGFQTTGGTTNISTSPITATITSGGPIFGGYNNSTTTINESSITVSTGSAGGYGYQNAGGTTTMTASPITISTATNSGGTIYGFQNFVGTSYIYSSPINAQGGATATVYGIRNDGTACTADESPITMTSTATSAIQSFGVYNSAGSYTMEGSPLQAAGLSNTGSSYGVYNDSGAPCVINSSSILSYTNGAGTAIGVSNHGASCTVTACPITAFSVTGTVWGVFNNVATGVCTVNSSTISGSLTGGTVGGSKADIWQSLGTVALNNTKLMTNSTNNAGFSASPTSYLTWSLQPGTNLGSIGASVNKYMQLGTDTVANLTNQTSQAGTALTATRPLIIRSLQVHSMTGPGGTITNTFTLYKNNGATSLATTLAGYVGASGISLGSISFTGSDLINMVTSTTSTTGVAQGITVTAEVY
jgi:hypothetical protein